MAIAPPNDMIATNSGPLMQAGGGQFSPPNTQQQSQQSQQSQQHQAASAPVATSQSYSSSSGGGSPIQIMDWESKLKKGDKTAQQRTVEANQTVADQLARLTASNSKYLQNARLAANERSAESGMLMSSVAAGASQRAAIDAGLPIAQQDANTYLQTAKDNMDAENADRLADQSMFGNLVGQETGIRANLDESERGRSFTTSERNASQAWQSGERGASQAWQSGENSLNRSADAARQASDQAWQSGEQALNRELDLNKQAKDQTWQSYEQALSRDASMTQLEKQMLQDRFKTFDLSLQNYNNNLSQTLSAIYSNPNLTASQQAAAAANAQALNQSLYKSYASTMAAGIPEIYWNPYQSAGAAGATLPAPTANLGLGMGSNLGQTGGGQAGNPYGLNTSYEQLQ